MSFCPRVSSLYPESKFSLVMAVINKVSTCNESSVHNIYKARDSGFSSQTLESQFKHL